eukprot:gene6792-30760_t
MEAAKALLLAFLTSQQQEVDEPILDYLCGLMSGANKPPDTDDVDMMSDTIQSCLNGVDEQQAQSVSRQLILDFQAGTMPSAGVGGGAELDAEGWPAASRECSDAVPACQDSDATLPGCQPPGKGKVQCMRISAAEFVPTTNEATMTATTTTAHAAEFVPTTSGATMTATASTSRSNVTNSTEIASGGYVGFGANNEDDYGEWSYGEGADEFQAGYDGSWIEGADEFEAGYDGSWIEGADEFEAGYDGSWIEVVDLLQLWAPTFNPEALRQLYETSGYNIRICFEELSAIEAELAVDIASSAATSARVAVPPPLKLMGAEGGAPPPLPAPTRTTNSMQSFVTGTRTASNVPFKGASDLQDDFPLLGGSQVTGPVVANNRQALSKAPHGLGRSPPADSWSQKIKTAPERAPQSAWPQPQAPQNTSHHQPPQPRGPHPRTSPGLAPPPGPHTSKGQHGQTLPEGVRWVETGVAVAAEYKAARAVASGHAKARNMFFQQVVAGHAKARNMFSQQELLWQRNTKRHGGGAGHAKARNMFSPAELLWQRNQNGTSGVAGHAKAQHVLPAGFAVAAEYKTARGVVAAMPRPATCSPSRYLLG